MGFWYSLSDLIGIPGMRDSLRMVSYLAKKQNWKSRPRTGRGGGSEYHFDSLPEITQQWLVRQWQTEVGYFDSDCKIGAENVDQAWDQMKRTTSKQRQRAYDNLDLVRAVDAERKAGKSITEALAIVSKKSGRSISTIQRCRRKTKNWERHDQAAALLPRYGSDSKNKSDIDNKYWNGFLSDYLRLEAPALSSCYERTNQIALKDGVVIPSVSTFKRKLQVEVAMEIRILKREGEKALEASYPAQIRDRSNMHALEAVNADGHMFDVFVNWDGKIVRPLMVAWQDIFSGKILSWYFDVSENQDAVRFSLGGMISKYGIPNKVLLDNGRAFASKWITGGNKTRYRTKYIEGEFDGILKNLDIELHWATPYHGQSKPIERAFRDLCESISKHPAFAGAYVGNNPVNKPENYGERAIDKEVFLEVAERLIHEHGAKAGRRGGVCSGRSFDQVFEESYQNSVIRKPSSHQHLLWMLAAEKVRCRKPSGNLGYKGNTYSNQMLLEYMGEDVIIRFDPKDLHVGVHVFGQDGTYICEAECMHAAGFFSTEAAREHSKARKSFQKATKERVKAMSLLSAQEIGDMHLKSLDAIDESMQSPKVIQPMFNNESKPAFKKAVNDGYDGDDNDDLMDVLIQFQKDR